MAIQRRCLVAGCGCTGYAMDMETYEGQETQDFIEGAMEELRPFCARCGHADEEHELAPSDE